MKPLILITNDDGVTARGINELIEAVRPLGRIVVVAPDKGFSAKSHSVTMEHPIFLRKLKEETDLTIFSSTGTPADCVKLAIHQVLTNEKPDIILSGINHGSNSSTSVVYSGTMAAAIEGTLNGFTSIGFSNASYDYDADFTASKYFANLITKKILSSGLPKDVCLNVNFPHAKLADIKGVKVSRQARAFWEEDFVRATHPRGQDYYWLTGVFTNTEPEDEGTDEWALKHNYVSVVPITIDYTAHHAINQIKQIDFENEKI